MSDTFLGEELERLRRVVRLSNVEFILEEDDPRNLDPDDEVMASLWWYVSEVEEAIDDLRTAVSNESRRRNDALDEMDPEDLEQWEDEIATLASRV